MENFSESMVLEEEIDENYEPTQDGILWNYIVLIFP